MRRLSDFCRRGRKANAHWRTLRRAIAPLAMVLGLAGCATPPPADDPDAVADFRQLNDPFEPANRVAYAINDGLDRALLRPVAIGYNDPFAPGVRGMVHNVLDNIGTPVMLANDMMQGKPRRAGDTLMRMVVNTTLGVGGLFDLATDWGWPEHDSDFGMTLAGWGAPEGPYLMLPFFGPSNPRDAVGMAADTFIAPTAYLPHGTENTIFSYTKTAMSAIDARAAVIDDLDRIKAQALDPYATLRSLVRQHRQSKIDEMKDDNRQAAPSAWAVAPK